MRPGYRRYYFTWFGRRRGVKELCTATSGELLVLLGRAACDWL
ncbi:MAG TPA: hypothetical protein VKV28_15870 [Candidatus Binataceae bacterium]|nr:hypothetical protein [Candidatus Binataceae bacterium]